MKMKKNALKGIILNRTVGVEVEGYTSNFQGMIRNGVRHSGLKRDGSLTGGNYELRGIEVVTEPISTLDKLDDVFEDITRYKWSVGRGTAGTHIHVDARDYRLEDKLKMAIFMEQIENAMFLMVKKYRWSRSRGYRNQYCRPIFRGWRDVLTKLNEEYSYMDWRSFMTIGDLQYALSSSPNRSYLSVPSTTRYQFVNIWSSSHRTIEFRIFHAIRSAKEAKMFSLLAYHLVELVKHSTLEQLDFIANGIINDSTSAEDMVKRLCESVGLEFTIKINNKELASTIDRQKQRIASRRVAV